VAIIQEEDVLGFETRFLDVALPICHFLDSQLATGITQTPNGFRRDFDLLVGNFWVNFSLASKQFPKFCIIFSAINDFGFDFAISFLFEAVQNLLSLSFLSNGSFGAVPLPDLETGIQNEDVAVVEGV